jgi:hypothetical protein
MQAGAMFTPNIPPAQPPSAMHPPAPGIHPGQGGIGQAPMPQPGAPYPAPYGHATPYAHHPQAGIGNWGWNGAPPAMQPQAAAPYPYSFGYAPGSRVQVTWSNGQRYPATVSQVSGTQCLVVFPDGQQHWVEMQYLSPS